MNMILRKNSGSNTFCMLRNSAIVLLFVFCLFIVAGCERDPKDSPERERLLPVSFTVRSMSGSLLKSAATEEEDSISKIILFGVNDQNNVIADYAIINNSTLPDTSLIISGKVVSLYAIANPSAGLETTIGSLLPPFPISTLTNLVDTFTHAPQSPFLMSCMEEVTGTSVDFTLVRAVAKIKIGITENGFQLDSIKVSNTPDKGYVFGKTSFSIPTSHTKVNYTAISAFGSDTTFYVAENTGANPTEFVVFGLLHGFPVSDTVVLKSGGLDIDIIRNTRYQVSVGFEYE